jgi:hypothetical protein
MILDQLHLPCHAIESARQRSFQTVGAIRRLRNAGALLCLMPG